MDKDLPVSQARQAVRKVLFEVEKAGAVSWFQLKKGSEAALLSKVLNRIDDRLFWIEHSVESGRWKDLGLVTPILVELGSIATGPSRVRPRFWFGKWTISEEYLWSLEGDLMDHLSAHGGLRLNNNSSTIDEEASTTALRDAQEITHLRRHERAREWLRGRRMKSYALICALLILLCGGVLARADGAGLRPWSLAAAVALGALGGTVSILRTFRDTLDSIRQLERFYLTAGARLVLASGLGLVSFLLWRADALPMIGSSREWDYAVYAWVAGFSEIVVLGAVAGIAGNTQPRDKNRQVRAHWLTNSTA